MQFNKLSAKQKLKIWQVGNRLVSQAHKEIFNFNFDNFILGSRELIFYRPLIKSPYFAWPKARKFLANKFKTTLTKAFKEDNNTNSKTIHIAIIKFQLTPAPSLRDTLDNGHATTAKKEFWDHRECN